MCSFTAHNACVKRQHRCCGTNSVMWNENHQDWNRVKEMQDRPPMRGLDHFKALMVKKLFLKSYLIGQSEF